MKIRELWVVESKDINEEWNVYVSYTTEELAKMVLKNLKISKREDEMYRLVRYIPGNIIAQ